MKDVIKTSYKESVSEIVRFVQTQQVLTDAPETKIPAALLVCNGDGGSSGRIFDEIQTSLSEEQGIALVRLQSSECPNLKAFLKALNQRAISLSNTSSAASSRHHSSTSLLPYDLQILHDWCHAQKVWKIVVALEDGEAFDAGLLTDAISLFRSVKLPADVLLDLQEPRSWSDRIPFLLMFGVSTSLELFEDRLPRSLIRSLEGHQISLPDANGLFEKKFQTCVCSEDVLPLQLGPGLCEMLVQRQINHLQSVDELMRSVQVCDLSKFCHLEAHFKSSMRTCAITTAMPPALSCYRQ